MQTVLITGASRGIGLAAAKKFLQEGWRVIGTHNTQSIPINSEQCTPIHLDLASQESIIKAVEEIKTHTNHLDALINNAGIILDQNSETIDISIIRKTCEVDLFAQIDLTNRLTSLFGKGSHVVNTNSTYGSFSFPMDDKSAVGYRIAKAGFNMYTRILAHHLEEKGIIVSAFDPGWVRTDMGNSAASETDGPDREPKEAAEELFALITKITETGYFWKLGQKREW